VANRKVPDKQAANLNDYHDKYIRSEVHNAFAETNSIILDSTDSFVFAVSLGSLAWTF